MMRSAISACATVACAVALVGCGTMNYQPARERDIAQLADQGCGSKGETFIVRGQVSKAYENTVVLWDGVDPQRTMAFTLAGRSPLQRMRGWFGENKYEASRELLNQLSANRTPVTVTAVCQGGQTAPVANNLTYTDTSGQRVAIGY